MIASDALLHRLEQDPSLAAALVWPGDFDMDRRDPIEDLVLPSGGLLHPVAGCGAGGTYFLCGEAGAEERPALYADSEGQATLIGANLVEAITLIAVLPFWRDLAKGFTISDLGSELRADHPDFDAERDRLLHALCLASISEEEAAERLLAVAARTAPDYVPRVPDDDYLPYELLFPSSPV
ncbi:hypothetical protein OH797_12890 [Streptomyces anulatus]|uniref:hypothetical protein n=1 Tax=Streptomyces TaxID=1883 RepID=UPI0006DB811E|nr:MULTISPECIES: hypothetical protein [Streptomyces]KPL32263.1 hypothetical protein JI76_24715 [Streptomyces anulatus]MBT1101077.1 hypothetical protein [Streptomyces sp. Tu10]WSC63836.1 hypothetical protein OHA57_25225 [Streptomyces anulatus]WTC63419.1 hypothetical protein OG865_13135 [Streptomyces anulatus]WTC73549.1 hypothetical protein OG882_25790 [Streptomyces anulatus]